MATSAPKVDDLLTSKGTTTMSIFDVVMVILFAPIKFLGIRYLKPSPRNFRQMYSRLRMEKIQLVREGGRVLLFVWGHRKNSNKINIEARVFSQPTWH